MDELRFRGEISNEGLKPPRFFCLKRWGKKRKKIEKKKDIFVILSHIGGKMGIDYKIYCR